MFSGSPFSGLPFADSGGFLYAASTADLASVSESVLGVKQQGGVVLGNMSLSDTYAPSGVYNISAFDTATVADAVYPLSSLGASVSERARAVITRQIGGGFSTGAMSSGPFSALGDFTREVPSDEVFSNVYSQNLVTNLISVADVIRTNAVTNISFIDSSTINDPLTNTASIASFNVNRASVAEDIFGGPEYSVAVQELMSGEIAISTLIIYPQYINENAVATEAVNTLVRVFSTVVNEAQVSELATTQIVVNSAVNDLVSSTDRLSTNIIVQSQCIELSHAVDELVARRYWENINTAESAGWRLVQNNIGID
jgi:hypothetical protein